MASIQIDALGCLFSAVGTLILSFVLFKIGEIVYAMFRGDAGYEVFFGVYCILGGIGVVLLLGYSLVQLFDIWNYAALINPKLYLAHTIVDHVLSAAK